MKRRQLVQAGMQSWLLGCVGAPGLALSQPLPKDGRPVQTLRFGTTTVFLDDQVAFLARWASYLTQSVGMPVEFVRRRAYRDIMGMLKSDDLDAAWICGYPWVVNRSHLRGLAMPMYHGEPWYQSYLIVPSKDQSTHSLRDLKGRTYAYSDPDSNSGCLVPRTTLIRQGIDPDRHFGRTFFTWGHRNVVSAVAAGLSDGGSVDGYVWDTLQMVSPAVVRHTRVAWRSDRYGFPPLVVRASLSADIERRLRDALLGMSDTPAGKRLLAELNLASFGKFVPEVFDGIAELVKVAGTRAS
jgi:phosphonate transport system substrate-binding protein